MLKIKDIVNRDIVTLTNCENEPIHIPGSIQPHGFLLALNTDSFNIDFCSGNIADYISVSHPEILGRKFSEIFGEENQNALAFYIASCNYVVPMEIFLFERPFRITIHKSDMVFILEVEKHRINMEKPEDVYNQTSLLVGYMNTTTTLRELCNLVARGTREITGYDRVMIYRFDADYNGEIFAEDCHESLEPFLGLHYPQSDIPVQARQLYMKNLMRMIVDINYNPVPIYTIDNATNKNLDLSFSHLRSTSPIHAEYLKNMGVGATLTISLLQGEKLWGLIACHHYSPKNCTPEIRQAAQLQGNFITSQIDVRQSREEYIIAKNCNIALELLNNQNIEPVEESYKMIISNPELLNLCNASGVSILVKGKVYKSGVTPSDKEIVSYSDWLTSYSNETTCHTNKIAGFMPGHENGQSTVSGILYHSLGSKNSIIWYRPETRSEVTWGGDPEKAIIHDDTGMHPRNSFNLWKEVIKDKSSDWLQPEINASANYAHALQKQISMILLTEEEERYRILSEVLQAANSELENINWISSHDLQEPLRKIQMIASRELSKQGHSPASSIVESLHKVTTSANRMQTLLSDILKYTRVQQTQDAFKNVSLQEILQETVEEMAELISDNNAIINYSALPNIVGIPFLLKQLFSNILQNSIKYASEFRSPVIEITASILPEIQPEVNSMYCHWVKFTDNGIGFDQKFSESIFNIFTRLHEREKYEGSGVGLALCKKIMQTNNGTITASGIPGVGATITLYFPYDK